MYKLSVLYVSDNNYAPLLGISMLSLFENNKDIDDITIYAALNSVSTENMQKLKSTADYYNRNFVIIDPTIFDIQLDTLGVPKWKGNHCTNYRLFFETILPNNIDRFIYLDCDTIICGSLKKLLNLDFQEKIAAVVLDVTIMQDYKQIIGFTKTDNYFNAGVMLININNWKLNNCTKKLLSYIKNSRSKYLYPDQDLLNILLKNKTLLLPPEYDFMPIHRLISDKDYYEIFGKNNYYSPTELKNARENPKILHTYNFIGQFPWNQNSWHPDNIIVDYYLQRSQWKNFQKFKYSNLSLLLKNILHKILPTKIFYKLFKIMALNDLKRKEKKIKKC